MQHKTFASTQKQLDNLTKMRYRDLISDEEFTKERNSLQEEIGKLKEQLRDTEDRAEKWLELTEKTFDFATYARKAFVTGDNTTKREMATALGQNWAIKDGELSIQANEWLQPIKNGYKPIEKDYLRLEPKKYRSTKAKTEALAPVIARWRGMRESNPRLLIWSQKLCHLTNPPYDWKTLE